MKNKKYGFLPLWSKSLFSHFFQFSFPNFKTLQEFLCVFLKSQMKYRKKVKSVFSYNYRIHRPFFSPKIRPTYVGNTYMLKTPIIQLCQKTLPTSQGKSIFLSPFFPKSKKQK